MLGNFYHEGKIDAQETIETNDREFGSAGMGTVDPHTASAMWGRTRASSTSMPSNDTADSACDSLAAWWEGEGRLYLQGRGLLLLCDGGGER